MQNIWAPWRMQYILEKDEEGCVFCKKKFKEDEAVLILYRGKYAFVVMNKFPYNNGHLLVTPFRHVKDLKDLDQQEILELMNLLTISTGILQDALKPEGFNIGVNLGKVAGAGVEDHIHFHVVPRWNGDTNFMPVLSETRVMPEHLKTTYDKLHPAFQRIK